jgi:hypothetical protein
MGTSPMTLNVTLTGLRFFFDITLKRPELMAGMHPVKMPHQVPVVLSTQESTRLITAASNVRYQAALSVAYGAGLRAREVIGLKVTYGLALTHHPHLHGIVPGGGLVADRKTWAACRPGCFLPVRVLSRVFRRRFLDELQRLHVLGKLQFFGGHAALDDALASKRWLALPRKVEWVVYAKRPFAGPQAVLA